MSLRWVVAVLAACASGCRCSEKTTTIPPSLGVDPASLDFGTVKQGGVATLELRLSAQSRAAVELSALRLEGAEAGAFSLGAQPARIEALGTRTLEVRFAPAELRGYQASLVIESDDAERAMVTVAVKGEGAKPSISVTPDCPATRGCMGSVTVSPPAIDFGPEPLRRLLPLDAARLPAVSIANLGPVDLVLTRLAVEGADAAAFTLQGNATLPAGGLVLAPMQSVRVPIRFEPSSDLQQSYRAQLAIDSDDGASPRVAVELSGTLSPDLPPKICANLVQVAPPPERGAVRSYGSAADWAPLLVAPAGGYDFSASRQVEPDDVVTLSAVSDAVDQAACTSDAEDGRIGLVYSWELKAAPPGAPPYSQTGAGLSQIRYHTRVSGTYVFTLKVKDAPGYQSQVDLAYTVALRQDLVAQLSWTGFDGIDFDVHLVRPSAVTLPTDPFSGAFDFFTATPDGGRKPAGDINPWAVLTWRNNLGAGYDFDWGEPGPADDPQLGIDDDGTLGDLENVSLNYPEHDAKCATATCTYKVLVHYFRDSRMVASPPPCTVSGAACADGLRCGCSGAGERCVADSAPKGDAGTGAGRCFPAPRPVVRIFLKGNPQPAAVIPLDSLMRPACTGAGVPCDDLAIGAPCQLWYVADVDWPAKSAIGSLADGGTPLATVTPKGTDGTGRIASPVIGRFGWRQSGSLQCTPDSTQGGGLLWYSRQE